ncbi:U-scoloptoxin(01)-Cw1a-like [Cylas formicarius]|uniref:U-scoloptoxin(01)-Cw1a-like n=1 Tax=Cylas formicarius TaxID=197179 RepID=UPI0029586C3B|nr:U-scoloptoxin(01)-Cw1a-like [Cylas formicarius]
MRFIKIAWFVTCWGCSLPFALCLLDSYVPGQDYPVYSEIPQGLSFRCDQKLPGYYSDPEAQCQVWHWCLPNGQKFSFLCPNGTIFNQFARVCDWFFNVDCPSTPNYYGINSDLYRVPPFNQDYSSEKGF